MSDRFCRLVREWLQDLGDGIARLRGPSSQAARAIAAGDASRDRKHYAEAARHYRAALETDPTLAAIAVQYGHMLKEAGDRRGSEAAYRHALQQAPDEADTHRQLGHVRKLQGDWTGALQAYARAVELDPTLDDLQPEMERVAASLDASTLEAVEAALLQTADEAVDRRDWSRAIERFGELGRRRPGLSTVWVRYGLALAKAGRRFPALRAFQHAVGLRPNLSQGWLHLGRTLTSLGEDAAARAAYRRAASLHPSSTLIGAALAELDREPSAAAGLVTAFDDGGQRVEDADPIWPRFRGAWLPRRMRELLAGRYGEDVIPLYTHLMWVVEAFAEQPASFRAPIDTPLMLERIRSAALHLGAAEVRASIIIPVFNNLVYTLTCIASILEHGARVPFEIIVGDDQSSDETFAVLTSIGGCLRIVRHATNLGFLHNCNRTAEFARGAFIVLLNNDTLVLPEWLDAMIATFEAYPAAGFVGSKLINGDGTLQEAGGIVWRDGSGRNFGRNADASRPEYNYLKEVDYVSGASIALPRALWDTLGGFDPIYAPGYCEDSDLAFRVRAAGFQTLYQPASSVIHHEGRSHGRDINTGVKSYQRINRQTLRARWQTTLDDEHLVKNDSVFVARDRSRGKTHMLVVSRSVPQWDRDAGSRTLYDYLKLFRDHGFQTTLWPETGNRDRESLRRLQDLGIEVLDASADAGPFPEWLQPHRTFIDYAFLDRPRHAQSYLAALAAGRTKVLYYGQDLSVHRTLRNGETASDPALLERPKAERAREAWSTCQLILAPRIEQAEAAQGWVEEGRPVASIPVRIFSDAALDAARAKLEGPDRADPSGLMFVGGFAYPANVDAIAWFVTEVMPLVRQSKPDALLRVAGSQAPQAVADLSSDHVVVLGRVSEDELQALYASSAVAVVPMRHGAGVRGKLIEAFVNGTPVVSTTLGVQGIDDPQSMAFVGDGPSAFARQVILAIDDRQEASRRAQHAVAYLRRHYTVASAVEALAPMMPELRREPAFSGAGSPADGPMAAR